jgi:indole-3-glycerol phosphate synthase
MATMRNCHVLRSSCVRIFFAEQYNRLMATYLDEILAHHRRLDSERTVDLVELRDRAVNTAPPRDFTGALREGSSRDGVAVISEIKRRSPSKGELAPGLDPAELASNYLAAGAHCLSVLTDTKYFGGSQEDLLAARLSVSIPTLRKDFTISIADIYDARIMSADAILLIVAALNDEELSTFHRTSEELGMAALVEVHDEYELERALAIGARIIGVNQRDLRTFVVDGDRARRVGAQIPPGIVRIAESGISTAADVRSLREAGFDAILVGEALVTAADPLAALRRLLGDPETADGRTG